MYFLQNKALESFYIIPTIYTSFLDLVARSTPFNTYNGALTIFKGFTMKNNTTVPTTYIPLEKFHIVPILV